LGDRRRGVAPLPPGCLPSRELVTCRVARARAGKNHHVLPPGGPLWTASATLLAGYLIIVLPVSGAVQLRNLSPRLAREPGLRSELYRRIVAGHWLLAGVTLALVGLSGRSLTTLGIQTPSHLNPIVAGWALLAVAAGAGALRVQTRALFLPVTRSERRSFIGVAVTAGVVEELLFRGYLLLYATGVAGLPVQLAVLSSAAAFGLGHRYQGIRPALLIALAGYGLAQIYVSTGSLLIPATLHGAINLAAVKAERSGREVQRSEIGFDVVAVVEDQLLQKHAVTTDQ
jgi:membrane protease YdiL (CAAX protease family)